MKENNVVGPYKFVYEEQSCGFTFNYSQLQPFLEKLRYLMSLGNLSSYEKEKRLQQMMDQREALASFDTSFFVDFNERAIVEVACTQVTPFVNNPGIFVITNQRFYFQPFNEVDERPVHKFELTNVKRVLRRRYLLRHTGIEILMANERGKFFSFKAKHVRERVMAAFFEIPCVASVCSASVEHDLRTATAKWQHHELSNFDYLMFLNDSAGRTRNDYTQYPVFPWVIADYESPVLELSHPATFRDLSKPIGALNAERLAMFKERYAMMPDTPETPKFLYGTHYSTPGTSPSLLGTHRR